MGHGFCLFLLGCYLLFTQAKADSRNPGALGALYPARYMLFLMGLFAIYTGRWVGGWMEEEEAVRMRCCIHSSKHPVTHARDVQ